jgi:hypothetical protein
LPLIVGEAFIPSDDVGGAKMANELQPPVVVSTHPPDGGLDASLTILPPIAAAQDAPLRRDEDFFVIEWVLLPQPHEFLRQ